MSAGAINEAEEEHEQHRRSSVTECRSGGITVRFSAEPPQLTPPAARVLLGILRELTDEEFSTRSKDASPDVGAS